MPANKQLDMPLGKIVGLTIFCIATLIGVCSGHNPEVVLGRVVIYSLLGLFVGFATGRFVVSITGTR